MSVQLPPGFYDDNTELSITDKRFRQEPNTKVRFYCESCSEAMPVKIHGMYKDPINNNKIWSDITCVECHLVLATISSDEEGEYDFVKK